MLRVFACSQRAHIFSSKKTKNSGLLPTHAFRTCDNMPGSHFFFEKNVKTRAVLQLRHSRRVFTCPQRARIFSSKKTKNSGLLPTHAFRTCDNMPGSHFFFEKNVKTRAVLQLRHSRRVFTCPQRARIFSSKKT